MLCLPGSTSSSSSPHDIFISTFTTQWHHIFETQIRRDFRRLSSSHRSEVIATKEDFLYRDASGQRSGHTWIRTVSLYTPSQLLEALSPLAETLESVHLQFIDLGQLSISPQEADRLSTNALNALITSITPFRALKGSRHRVPSLAFLESSARPGQGLSTAPRPPCPFKAPNPKGDVIRFEDAVSKRHIPNALREVRLYGGLSGLHASGWVPTDWSIPQDSIRNRPPYPKRTYRKGSIQVISLNSTYKIKERAFEELEAEVLSG
ncbi:uncharacterized protein B0T15DRAFT_523070 [Chaetomium strumarium]|uniref:Uncharacterized protein n=1 Tax=Chaetomium strumarium TaxID=1170767 RepID=A0AAJ0GXD8_9PEZI|nr:hypothetical protein B0T15DRAFT_523070 [Chaetomium strumarium]